MNISGILYLIYETDHIKVMKMLTKPICSLKVVMDLINNDF